MRTTCSIWSAARRRESGDQDWATDSPEVNNWFRLYRNLYGDETQAGESSGQVPGNQGQRAWRGTLIAMLRSPRIVIY